MREIRSHCSRINIEITGIKVYSRVVSVALNPQVHSKKLPVLSHVLLNGVPPGEGARSLSGSQGFSEVVKS